MISIIKTVLQKEREWMRDKSMSFLSPLIAILLVAAVILTDPIAKRMCENAEETKEKLQEGVLQIQADESMEQNKTYLLTELGSDQNLFTNRADGYTVIIPADLAVDMRFSNIRAVLESDKLKLEIYRQEIDQTDKTGVESYINYSNLFINNSIDHYKELEGSVMINGRKVSFLQWSRRALERIENDKCHYASVEVPISEMEVITFLFKSCRKFQNSCYLDIVKSLNLTEITAKPYVQRIKKTENPNWDEKTVEVYQRLFGDHSRLQWGIFETDAPIDFTELKKIENKLDFTFPILVYYTGILENRERHPHLAAALKNAGAEGRILELTLQTAEQTPGKGNMVYDVLDGKYDVFLKNYAIEVADSGNPVLFRLGNEMNGDWCVYSAHHTARDTDIFIAFYRYIYDIFRESGADNVIWVWNPNGKSFPDYKWNDELCYYPGDEYADVIGMTGYNTGTYYEGETWLEFNEMYDSLYEKYIGLCEKPLMITEFASSSVGGSKESWVKNMFRHITKYKRIKAAIWWDGCDRDQEGNVARPYFIDETEELVRIFRENLARFR
jgi:hypothetical protein